jgi:hypothetical protein
MVIELILNKQEYRYTCLRLYYKKRRKNNHKRLHCIFRLLKASPKLTDSFTVFVSLPLKNQG